MRTTFKLLFFVKRNVSPETRMSRKREQRLPILDKMERKGYSQIIGNRDTPKNPKSTLIKIIQ